MRFRSSRFGSRPRIAPRLSVMCSGFDVPGITAVTRLSASKNLRKNSAQLCAKSCAQSGIALPRTALNSRARPSGTAVNTAAGEALCLPLAKPREGLPRVAHVVQLEKVHARYAQSRERSPELADVRRFDLGRKKETAPQASGRDGSPEDVLRIAVGRSGVDQPAASGNERLDDVTGVLARFGIVAIEHVCSAEADARQALARARNRARENRGLVSCLCSHG